MRLEVIYFQPVGERKECVKQMAVWVRQSQQRIKLDNIFTPTARHNDMPYPVSTTEYETQAKILNKFAGMDPVICQVLISSHYFVQAEVQFQS